MKVFSTAFLKFYSQTYFIASSFYCFLAFVPFTHLFVIVNPPYRWIVVYAHYNVLLIWIAVAASILCKVYGNFTGVDRGMAVGEVIVALIVSVKSPISHIPTGAAAFTWSTVFLLPPFLSATDDFIRRARASRAQDRYLSVAYSDAVLIGLFAGLISIAAPRLQSAMHGGLLVIQSYDAVLMFWVLVEHVTLAVLIASLINLLRFILSQCAKNSFLSSFGAIGLVLLLGLSSGCLFLVENSLSLRGLPAWTYSILFALTLTLCGLSLLAPIIDTEKRTKMERWLLRASSILLIAIALYAPLAVDPSDDWNGILHQVFPLLLWVVLAIGISHLRSMKKHYTVWMVLAVALATWGGYETLNYSEPVWASAIGPNRMQIHRELNNYSALNPSFGLADRLLGNQEAEHCDADCKTLRQYSNIQNAKITQDLNLVDDLVPNGEAKPNIFIFVIDSLRPDYLGAYNPRVDFTPNIDAFARESIVMRRAYTDYAGTSLSEPSIWSGALLLHAHYAQPFEKVNSLRKLARADGYQMVITYDSILRELMAPSEDFIKLDTDKKTWGQVEISSTMRQFEGYFDHRPTNASPVFFYTQPMNVQGRADNDLPKRTNQNWQTREGFDDRIAYTLHQTDEFLGAFFSYLKSKGAYENSIVILTADHGDATGELGRRGHSTILYPEIIRVPLIIHLPSALRSRYVYDENRISTLIDIAPSLYYLLGHRPIKPNPMTGRPIFVENLKEYESYPRNELFLASDALAAYGILAEDGRWMYTTYDSPSRSMLFDLLQDPKARENVLTPELKKQYDDRILRYLQLISRAYGHHPTGG